MEAAAFAWQGFRQGQAAGAGIVAAQRALQRLHRHRHAVHAAQPFGDGVVHLGRRRRRAVRSGDRFGGFLQRRKMVGAVVEEVARLLVRQHDAAAGRQRDAAGILARHAPGAIQRQDRAGGVRRAGGQSASISGLGYGVGRQQRVGEGFAQADLKLAFLRAGNVAQIDPQRLAPA